MLKRRRYSEKRKLNPLNLIKRPFKINQQRSQIEQNIDPNRPPKRFRERPGSHWGPYGDTRATKSAPKSSRAPQERPRATQEWPRPAQERPRAAQEWPRAAEEQPGAPQERPKSSQHGPRAAEEETEELQNAILSKKTCFSE